MIDTNVITATQSDTVEARPDSHPDSRMPVRSGRIPVENRFHMLMYAWQVPDMLDDLDAVLEDAPTLRALLTWMLSHYTRRLIRRGLRGDYVDISEPLRTVRGRIDFTRTVSGLLLHRGELHCDYQEYSLNVPRNQIIISTLFRQLGDRYAAIERENTEELAGLRSEVEVLVRRLSEIDRVHISDRMIATEMRKLGRNEREYRLVMLICQLLNRPRLPEYEDDGSRFGDVEFLQKERVYEKFVANFYRYHHGDQWVVEPQRQFRWPETVTSTGTLKLPVMRPDIVMRHRESGRVLIIDTKWSGTVAGGRYDKRVKTGDLYQVWSYLSSQEHRRCDGDFANSTGILLYAQPYSGLESLETRIRSHPFRVHTLDLSQPWQRIEDDLRGLIRAINMDRQDLQD